MTNRTRSTTSLKNGLTIASPQARADANLANAPTLEGISLQAMAELRDQLAAYLACLTSGGLSKGFLDENDEDMLMGHVRRAEQVGLFTPQDSLAVIMDLSAAELGDHMSMESHCVRDIYQTVVRGLIRRIDANLKILPAPQAKTR